MTDIKVPSAEAMAAARRAVSRFDRWGPTHGDLGYSIAAELDAYAEQRAAEAQRAAFEQAMEIAKGAAQFVRGRDVKFISPNQYAEDLAMDIYDGIRALADQGKS